NELQLGAGAAVLELDAEPPPPLAQLDAVDRGNRPAHDLAQGGLAHAHRAAGLLDEHPAQEPARAGNRAPASSRNDVEYSPERNSSLSRMSSSTSRVVGTPSTTSSRRARRARSVAGPRLPAAARIFRLTQAEGGEGGSAPS